MLEKKQERNKNIKKTLANKKFYQKSIHGLNRLTVRHTQTVNYRVFLDMYNR